MKKILFFATILAMASSCVDEGFDLSRVDTDDIVIGSDESKFIIPLANITVKSDAVKGEDGSLESMLRDADLLIAASFGKIDLRNVPADAIVDALFDELRTERSRRQEVGEFLEDSKYRNEVVSALPANLRGLDLSDVFINHIGELYNRKELRDKMRDIIVESLGSFNDSMPSVSEKFDGFGIDEDLIDMLTGTGEIRLFGTVDDMMPIDGKAFLVLKRDDGSGETILKLELPLDYNGSSKDFSTVIDDSVLHEMVWSMEMQVSLEPSSYYPRKPFAAADNTVLKIALKLEKQGGLNI